MKKFKIAINFIFIIGTIIFSHISIATTTIGVRVNDLYVSSGAMFIHKGIVSELSGGVVIKEVAANSPASKSGLKVGDIIISYNNVNIPSEKSFVDQVQSSEPNISIPIIIAIPIIARRSSGPYKGRSVGIIPEETYSEPLEEKGIDWWGIGKKVVIGAAAIAVAVVGKNMIDSAFDDDDCLRPDGDCTSSQLRKHKSLLAKAKQAISNKLKDPCPTPSSAEAFIKDIVVGIGYHVGEAITVSLTGDPEHLIVDLNKFRNAMNCQF